MAKETGIVTRPKKSIGDVAVDGLLAGMAAGVVMGVALLAVGVIEGVGPVEILGRFDPAEGGSAAVGGLLHLAVSGIYGVAFAILFRLLTGRWSGLKRYGSGLGIVYGLALWMAAHFLLLPELNSALTEISAAGFALSHLMYGAALGHFVSRHDQN